VRKTRRRKPAGGANAAHGVPRTNEDKRRAVMKLLQDAEWSHWSDREISKHAAVSHEFVRKLRPDDQVTVNVDSDKAKERTFKTKHGTVATMNTGNIGTKQKSNSNKDGALPNPKPNAQHQRDLDNGFISAATGLTREGLAAGLNRGFNEALM